MTRVFIIVAITVSTVTLELVPRAYADPGPSHAPTPTSSASMRAGDRSYSVQFDRVTRGQPAVTGVTDAGAASDDCTRNAHGQCSPPIVCIPGEEAIEVGSYVVGNLGNGYEGPCLVPKTEPDRDLTPTQVLRAFRRIPLPQSRIDIQPPGGRTLVNFDTILSVKARPLERTVRLLGRPVHVRIWASSFTWHWGDESDLVTTNEPGRHYEQGLPMDSYITHQYVDADVTVRPWVDVTYSAEFRVRGGTWRPVIGSVTIEGVPARLRIVEARPVLVGG